MKSRKSISDPSFNLRYLIKAAGITQVQFAEMLGVGDNTVRRWCAGRSKPSLEPDQYDIALGILRCTSKEFRVAVENACPIKVSQNQEKKLEKNAA